MPGSRLQRYILLQCISALLMVLGVFIITIMLIDVVEQLRTVGGDVSLSLQQAAFLAAMKLPGLIEQTLPFALLISAMITYNQLNKTSELSVIRAIGQSAWQFLSPVLFLAVMLGLFAMSILNPLGAHLSERFETERAELLRDGGRMVETVRQNIWLRQGSADTQLVIHAERVDINGRIFKNVKLLEESRIYDGARATDMFRFSRRIDADQAIIIDGFWQLTDLVENIPGQPPVRMTSLAIETDLDPNKLLSRFTSPNTIGFWDLPDFILSTNRAGLDTSRFTMRWFGLTSLPILYAAMALIGALVCLKFSRSGGTSRLIAIGAGAAASLFFINQLAASFGASGAVPPAIAAWSPALCALFLALTTIAYQEDG